MKEQILTLNALALIAFDLMVIAFVLVWYAFYKKPPTPKSSPRVAKS